MTLTLAGRLQTRLLLVLLVGGIWTAAITPILPRPDGLTLAATYRMTYLSLGLMAITGLAWEFVYHLLQQLRWDKDWPSLLSLLTVGNEAIGVWLLGRALGLIPAAGGPVLALFAIHFVGGYLAIWAVMQGPMRVVLVRWRFAGGRLIERASPPEDAAAAVSGLPPDVAGRTPVDAIQDGTPDGVFVEGVLCHEGHFNHPRARYCAVCGHSLNGTGHSRVRARRPPLGILIADDGTSCVVDHDIAVVTADQLRFERLGGEPPASCCLQIRLVEWQCVAVSADRCVPASLPDGRRLLLEPHSSFPLLPGSELVVDDCRVLFESRHQPAVRNSGAPEPPARRSCGRAARLAARLFSYLTAAAAMVLATHIFLVVLHGNPGNIITVAVGRIAAFLSPGFNDLFMPADHRLRVALDDGLAATTYLIAGQLLVRLVHNRGRSDEPE